MLEIGKMEERRDPSSIIDESCYSHGMGGFSEYRPPKRIYDVYLTANLNKKEEGYEKAWLFSINCREMDIPVMEKIFSTIFIDGKVSFERVEVKQPYPHSLNIDSFEGVVYWYLDLYKKNKRLSDENNNLRKNIKSIDKEKESANYKEVYSGMVYFLKIFINKISDKIGQESVISMITDIEKNEDIEILESLIIKRVISKK